MNNTVHVGQLDIVVLAQNHNPSILNPDFLYRNHIVEEAWGWDLSEPPFSTPVMSRVSFTSHLAVTAEPERLIFHETDGESIPETTLIAEVATKYVATLPHVAYVAVGINPTCHIVMPTVEAAKEYVLSKYMRKGPWLRCGGGCVAAAVKLTLALSDATLDLSIFHGLIGVGKESGKPCVAFQGNVHRKLKGNTHQEKQRHLEDLLGHWKNDYTQFINLVEKCFIGEQET